MNTLAEVLVVAMLAGILGMAVMGWFLLPR